MDIKLPHSTRPPVRSVSQQDLQRRAVQSTGLPPTPPRPQAQPRPRSVPAISLAAPKPSWLWRTFQIVMSVLILAAIISIGAWLVWDDEKNSVTAIDTTKYQAVFLENGQVYYGKLQPLTDTKMKMTDVYYLQPKEEKEADSTKQQETTTDSSSVELIKLGEEVHGPEDEVIILTDQLLYYENLKSDSKLVQSIERYKQTQSR